MMGPPPQVQNQRRLQNGYVGVGNSADITLITGRQYVERPYSQTIDSLSRAFLFRKYSWVSIKNKKENSLLRKVFR